MGEKKDRIGRWLIINIFIAFICLVLLGERFIIGYDPPLFIVELIAIPVNIEIFLIPILVLMYIIMIIKCRIAKVPMNLTRKKILGIILVLIMGLYFIWFFNGYRGIGSLTEVKKYEYNGKYYIYNGDMKLRCTANEYNLILEDKTYFIGFSYNKLLPNKGKLEKIRLVKSQKNR